MKFFVTILTAIVLSFSSGCIEMMSTGDKKILTSSVDDLILRVDEFQDIFAEAAKVDLIDAKATRRTNEKIDEIQDVMVAVNEAIKESPTLIEGVIAANQVSVPVNPYAGVIDTVLKILAGTAVVGGAGVGVKISKDGKEKKEIKVNKALVERKLRATNRANEKLRMKHPELATEHYELVGRERTTS